MFGRRGFLGLLSGATLDAEPVVDRKPDVLFEYNNEKVENFHGVKRGALLFSAVAGWRLSDLGYGCPRIWCISTHGVGVEHYICEDDFQRFRAQYDRWRR